MTDEAISPTTGRYFHIPCGVLVPGGVDNLLVAGGVPARRGE